MIVNVEIKSGAFSLKRLKESKVSVDLANASFNQFYLQFLNREESFRVRQTNKQT